MKHRPSRLVLVSLLLTLAVVSAVSATAQSPGVFTFDQAEDALWSEGETGHGCGIHTFWEGEVEVYSVWSSQHGAVVRFHARDTPGRVDVGVVCRRDGRAVQALTKSIPIPRCEECRDVEVTIDRPEDCAEARLFVGTAAPDDRSFRSGPSVFAWQSCHAQEVNP
jgi:hypothetical protein